MRRGLRLSGSQVAAEVMPDRVPADRQNFSSTLSGDFSPEILPGLLEMVGSPVNRKNIYANFSNITQL